MSSSHQRTLSGNGEDNRPQNRGSHERVYSAGANASSKELHLSQSRPVPMPRKLTSNSDNIDSMRTLKLSDGYPSSELQSLQQTVEKESVTVLKMPTERCTCGSQFEDLKKKEAALADLENNLHLMKSRMESENSDREYELNQKQRELQHLEDQLHMKTKELKQKEFDISNSETSDGSSDQLAKLAERQYELDQKDKELVFREERLREWSLQLHDKERENMRRFDELQHREAYFYSQTQYHNFPAHTGTQQHHEQRMSPKPTQTAPQNVYENYPPSNYSSSNPTAQQFRPDDHASQYPSDQPHAYSSSQVNQHHPDGYSSSQVNQHHPDAYSSSQVNQHHPDGYSSSQVHQHHPDAYSSSQVNQHHPGAYSSAQVNQHHPDAYSSAQVNQHHPDAYSSAQVLEQQPNRTSELLSKLPLKHDATVGPLSKLPLEHGATVGPLSKLPLEHGATVGPLSKLPLEHGATMKSQSGNQRAHSGYVDDLEYAKALMEQEAKKIETTMSADEQLALFLQQEEMGSSELTSGNQLDEAGSLIKKELDERLTEEQRRKRQEEEDFNMAKRLYSDDPSETS